MCVTWTRTNGTVDQDNCDFFANTLVDLAFEQGIYDTDFFKPFYCSKWNVPTVWPNLPVMQACADFKTEAGAKQFGNYIQNGGGFDDIALAVNFANAVVAIGGTKICVPSELKYNITDMTGKDCETNVYAQACAVGEDQFPYCECKPGAMLSTPYNVTYTRKFSKSGNNHYCFKINVDKGKCSSRCCNMKLEKIEWMSDLANCRYAVAGWTVSTKPNAFISPVWDMKPDTLIDAPNTVSVAVLKTNNLDLDTSNANGVEVCIALKGDGKCPTMEQFCYDGMCKYAVFDLPLGCCAKDYAPGNDFGMYKRR